jgi:hypothetical protein
MSRRTLSGIAIVGVFVLLHALTAHAAALRPGDIVVTEQASGRIYIVDPVSGSVSSMSSDLLGMPMQLAIDDAGHIYTAEREGGVRPGIVRVDPGYQFPHVTPTSTWISCRAGFWLERQLIRCRRGAADLN